MMKKGYTYTSDNPPDWYWKLGLHDACIVDAFEIPFDYNKYVGEKNNCNRNALSLQIDASGAIYDTRVKEIRFFNYKILTEEITLQGRNKVWWLADRLTEIDDGFYILEIDLQDFDSFPEEFTFKIKFNCAEVDRI